MYGPVWDPLPQTAAVAEWTAWAVAHQLAEAPSIIRSDCQSVVEGSMQRLSKALDCCSSMGGFHKAARASPGWRFVQATHKVKAHQNLPQVVAGGMNPQGEEEHRMRVHLWAGNLAADEFARRGAELHNDPAISEDSVEWQHSCLETLGRMLAAVWHQWPKAAAHHGQELVAGNDKPVACMQNRRGAWLSNTRRWLEGTTHGHQWTFAFAKWRCGRCLLWRHAFSPRHGSKCKGSHLPVVKIRKLGHHLVAFADGKEGTVPFVWICIQCGAWAQRVPKLLMRHCPLQVSAAGKEALRRVAKGLHPGKGAKALVSRLG